MIKDIPFQIDVAKRILGEFEKGVKNVLLIAPTGCGKSGIAYQVYNQSLNKICILSHLKTLQDQYDELFSNLNNSLCIKGQSNYECLRYQGLSVDKAPCRFNVYCDLKKECEYFILRKELKNIDIGLINYQFLFSVLNTGTFDFKKPIFIFDECHSIEDIFTDFCKVDIYEKDKDLFEKLEKKCVEWCVDGGIYEYITECLSLHNKILEEKPEDIEEFKEYYENINKIVNILSSFILENVKELTRKRDIQLFSSVNTRFSQDSSKFFILYNLRSSNNYVVEYKEMNTLNRECSIIPIDVSSIFRDTISNVSEHNVFMSATILGGEKFLKNLGLEKEKYSIIELDSKFPLKNRVVSYIPTAKMNSKITDGEFKNLLNVVESICHTHINDNDSGVIFTPSYELSKTISTFLDKTLKYKCNILINSNSSDREFILEKFRNKMKSDSNILISPSFFEGVNFEDEISRFQIIPKVPFKSLGSKYVRKKMEKDREWYELSALLLVIQACGRSIRHEKDFSDTYILDSNFGRLFMVYKRKGYIPKWFEQAVKWIS